MFPYAFVQKSTTPPADSSDDDATSPPREVDIEYTGIDSIDRQRAMQECCGVVPLSQVVSHRCGTPCSCCFPFDPFVQLREPYSSIRLIAEHLPIEQYYGLKKPPVRQELLLIIPGK